MNRIKITMKICRLHIVNPTERTLTFIGTGFSSNMVFIIWAVFGGFILHFLMSNYLTVLVKPTYEKPIETLQDMIDMDITPYYIPGGVIYKDQLLNTGDKNLMELGRRLIIPRDWDHYYDLGQAVITDGTYANLGGTPDDDELAMGTWYRSRDTLGGDYPFGQDLINKKWPLAKGISFSVATKLFGQHMENSICFISRDSDLTTRVVRP